MLINPFDKNRAREIERLSVRNHHNEKLSSVILGTVATYSTYIDTYCTTIT